MTEKQRQVIERARATPAQFVIIPRLDRHTAAENNALYWAEQQAAKVTACLEEEQRRLLRNWNQP